MTTDGATGGAVDGAARGPLADLRVVDLATVIAGPGCARYLADYGADVIKVERPPGGDSVRSMGWTDPADGRSMWWKVVGRNKRTIALDLKDPDDLEVMRRLLDSADVLVENFRPGTLERLGLAPEVLHRTNPSLVVTRVTGFGQTGPYKDRPGFATQAEALSGFAAINGEPDGQPLLPPIALTDEVAALVAAFATMVALHSGVGQVVDVNLIESMLQLMGPLVPLYGVLGQVQERLGAGIPYTVPRNTYRTGDGRWVAVSTSAESVAGRVIELIGLGGDPRFADFAGRVAHRDEIDARMAEWMAERTTPQVLDEFEAAHAAVAPVYDMADIAEDPHFRARGAIVEIDGFPMQDVVARLSATPGAVRWVGRGLDEDGDEIRRELDAAD
ncbi:CaiB/BaiF CoA transferase family protein [Dermatobacter hominis]|uniref:CaiB/BaiF CoA transferase family protein n=1 Tax=Dermatobacter hominis TaxID=2884263 RepID=UPI001D105072|nr:CoA transferase [Dermatobacter hominis]UDY34137.1 CoA transferase [Dermatobacter hominis]